MHATRVQRSASSAGGSLSIVCCVTHFTEYRVLLEQHHPDIEQLLDLPTLIPRLNTHHLLTPGQAEHLSNEHYSHSQRVLKLLEYIQKKGAEGYRRFLRAIEEETTHMGHKELYAILAKSKPSKLLDHN